MNTQHTPGPWRHDATWSLIKHGKAEIAAIHSGNGANAALIAAAPDLLAALDGLLAVSPKHPSVDEEGLQMADACAKARAAIAKATQEE